MEAITKTNGIIKNGNFASESVDIITTTSGTQSNLAPKSLNQISGNPPFNGAGVINLGVVSGGKNIESDVDLRNRISEHISGLSKGTIRAIKSSLLEVTNSATSQVVQRAKVVEDFENNEVKAYISDGSTDFFGDTSNFASDTLAESVTGVTDQLKLESTTSFLDATKSSRKYIIIDPVGSSGIRYATSYASVGFGEAIDMLENLLPATPENHTFPENTSVFQVELVSKNTPKTRKYYFLEKFPLTEDKLFLFVSAGTPTDDTEPALGTATLLVENTDYLLNKSTGQIEFLVGKLPDEGSSLIATYETFIGLIKSAQTTLDGSLDDFDNFPGVRSAGVKVRVLAAKTREINLTLNLTVDTEVTNFETASFLTLQFATSYINNLDVGAPVIMAEIIDRAMGVLGVTNIKIIENDVSILFDEVAVTGTLTFI